MPNCKCCGKPVSSGVVFHTECLGEPFDTEKAMSFIEQFAFLDSQLAYSNGTMLVPMSRVRDALVNKAGQERVHKNE